MSESTQKMLSGIAEMARSVQTYVPTGLFQLKDTPTGYLGHSGDYLVVNDGETGIHFTGIEKIAADLTDYGFGGGDSTIPSYTELPDVTENDGKIVSSGCDLYHSCNGTWNKIGGESIPAPVDENIPDCVETLEDYNNYTNYVDSVISNGMSSAFEEAFDFGVKENFFNDVCLYKEVGGAGNSQSIVKIQQSNYQFGIFEDNTTINIVAETPVNAGYCTSLHIKSDVTFDPNAVPGYDVGFSLQSNTTDGSTTFTDSSQNNLTISNNGTVQHSTAVVKYGTSSLDFNTPSYLSVPGNSPELLFENGDNVSIECWFHITDDPVLNDYGWTIPMISKGANNTTLHGWNLGYVHPNAPYQTQDRGKLVAIFNGGGGWGVGSWGLFGSTVLNKNEWYHVALVREDGVWNLYLNGVLESSSNDITGGNGAYLKQSNYNLTIGAGTSYSSGATINTNNGFIGYLQDVRISRGSAYSQNFTPPTTFLDTVGEPDTRNPERLLIKDSSPNNISIQNITDIQHVGDITSIYGPSSIYINNHKYLLIDKQTPSLNFTETDALTFEFWVNYINIEAKPLLPHFPIIAKGAANTLTNGWLIGLESDGTLVLNLMQARNNGDQVYTNQKIPSNQWTHVAVTRSSDGHWNLYIGGVKQDIFAYNANYSTIENNNTLIEYNASAFNNSAFDFTIATCHGYYSPHNLETTGGFFNGYLQDIRVVKGAKIYDNNFTPSNTFLSSECESSSQCNFIEWKTSDTSIIGDVNSNQTTALINQDTSITGVFNCT
jgi:hypothetical protein